MTSFQTTNVDLPTLMAHLHRASVGFDNMFDNLHRFAGSAESAKYPPHDIVKHSDTSYTVEVAVAGFREEDLDITVENSVLTIKGSQADRNVDYLHRGISSRNFTKVLNLAEHVVVKGARLENGLLIIDVEIEVPEELKPRRIAISASTAPKIEVK
jgi:molecular chaperone IbpA